MDASTTMSACGGRRSDMASRAARMRALYIARVKHGLCPACESPAQHDGHIYCFDCRLSRAIKAKEVRYLTSLAPTSNSSHTQH